MFLWDRVLFFYIKRGKVNEMGWMLNLGSAKWEYRKWKWEWNGNREMGNRKLYSIITSTAYDDIYLLSTYVVTKQTRQKNR